MVKTDQMQADPQARGAERDQLEFGEGGARGGVLALGIRANLPQFLLLAGANGLVGAMVGQERTVLPLLATQVFGLSAGAAVLTFLVAFGLSKALANLLAGNLADRFGRKPVLVAGWLIGLPVPLLIIAAPDWSWIVGANALLGIHQGLTWSMTLVMMVDLAGPARRGVTLGLNEAAGYVAVALTALVTGLIAEVVGLRPAPFLVGLVVAAVGLGISAVLVRETRRPSEVSAARDATVRLPFRTILVRTSFADPTLRAASQAGLVNNLNDGLAWGLLPLHYGLGGLSLGEIAVVTATYPAIWGLLQVPAGAASDRLGRRPLIVAGMLIQAAALVALALGTGFGWWLAAAAALGVGTAMVYPTLLAAVADAADPAWRAGALGVYRLWRDLGFAVGGLAAGILASATGIAGAIAVVGLVTAASGVVAALTMRETHPRAAGTVAV